MPPSFKAALPPEPEQPTSIEHRVITMVIIISWFFIILTPWLNVLRFQRLHLARWCNGSTADSESVCHGSNPCRAANSFAIPRNLVRPSVRNTFVKRVVAHHNRGGAATGEAFDEFDRELSVLRRLRAVRVRVQTELVAKMFVQFISAAERATQRPADLDLVFAHRLLPEHRVKRHDFIDVDGLQL